MMKDPNRLCPGCMNEWGDSNKPCPECGFIEKEYERPPRWLPLRYILNGKYMIGKVIGEGGFGITYLGWDLNLQIRVAIKEYFPVGLATREAANGNSISSLPGVRRENYRQGLEKFMTEAKNLSKFYNLPGIVSVRDFFFENETAYMVMEYVDGITLGAYLKKHGGQISEQEALQLFHPVMDSLKVVHQAGIIHRDISPDNIMMTKDGQMKLIDFGAARFAGGDTERSLTIILKHGYAPAEQYQSHGNQGPWTDVYAISSTMYRMITGKVAPSAMDRLHQDTLQEFSALGCRVSTKTAYAIIDKGMAIRVSDRYQNMDELIQGLYGIDRKKIHRKKQEQKKKMAIGITAAAAAAALCIGIGMSLFRSASAPSGEVMTQSRNQPKKSVSKEELAELQKDMLEAEKKISAGETHFVSIREDGSVAGSGTNNDGNLDVERWKNVTAVSAGASHTVGVKEDGTAVSAGNTSDGKCAVDTWKDIVKVSAGKDHTLGLLRDGTVVGAGSNRFEQCQVSSWTDITDIAAGDSHSLGLKSDGTVVAAGRTDEECCHVEDWDDVVQVEAGKGVSVGLKSDGKLVMAGETAGMEEALKWEQVIDISLGNGYIAAILSDRSVTVTGNGIVAQDTVGSWRDIESIAAAGETLFGRKKDGSIVRTTYSYGTAKKEELKELTKVVSGGGYLLGLKKDGTVVTWGVSGKQFGQEDLSDWSDIIDIAASADGALGLKSDGTVVSAGDTYRETESWSHVESIIMAENAAVGLKSDGSLLTCGEEIFLLEGLTGVKSLVPAIASESLSVIKEDGSLESNNITYQDPVNAVKASGGKEHVAVVNADGTVTVPGYGAGGYANVYSWKDIVQTAAGEEHTVGLKSDGTVVAAGVNSNGQCNVNDWTDVVFIAAGAYYTLGLQSDGTLLIAGTLPGEF